MKLKHSKNNSNISGEIKTPKESVMKKLRVGEVNKCNQQGKHPKTMVKADGEKVSFP